ncbi:Ig-like domain-containing protein, partial [Burkholderia sp. LMU1-1-1.1]
ISAPSAPLVVTIDRAAPGAPGAPVLDAASDTGVSDADKLTKDATPTLTGSAEAGATVKLYDGTTLVGSGVANADGVWTVTTGTLAA